MPTSRARRRAATKVAASPATHRRAPSSGTRRAATVGSRRATTAATSSPWRTTTTCRHDGRECTVEACAKGVATSTPQPAGTPCSQDDGRFCSAAGTCQFCAPLDDACTDPGPGEPNDTQETAHSFGEITDDDDAGSRFCAALSATDTVDWYTYTGRDDFLAEVDPSRTIGAEDDVPLGELRICKFVACLEGPTVFTCPDGTTPDVAPGGQQGCCAQSQIELSDDFLADLCSDTSDDDAQVWIRVERVGDAACIPYDLAYHF
jgi:hypothetical protein